MARIEGRTPSVDLASEATWMSSAQVIWIVSHAPSQTWPVSGDIALRENGRRALKRRNARSRLWSMPGVLASAPEDD